MMSSRLSLILGIARDKKYDSYNLVENPGMFHVVSLKWRESIRKQESIQLTLNSILQKSNSDHCIKSLHNNKQ